MKFRLLRSGRPGQASSSRYCPEREQTAHPLKRGLSSRVKLYQDNGKVMACEEGSRGTNGNEFAPRAGCAGVRGRGQIGPVGGNKGDGAVNATANNANRSGSRQYLSRPSPPLQSKAALRPSVSLCLSQSVLSTPQVNQTGTHSSPPGRGGRGLLSEGCRAIRGDGVALGASRPDCLAQGPPDQDSLYRS